MRGVAPAVIGALAVSLVQIAPHAAPDVFTWILMALTVGVILLRNVGPLPLVASGAVIGLLVCFVVGLYSLLPKHGDIWWPDASRHALNGAFVLDFLNQLPLRHPVDFAYAYYRQYPALTIGFYPPLFSVALAGFYALFRVCEAAALLCELAFLLLLACGAAAFSLPIPCVHCTSTCCVDGL